MYRSCGPGGGSEGVLVGAEEDGGLASKGLLGDRWLRYRLVQASMMGTTADTGRSARVRWCFAENVIT
jgi:hypothetical protein